MQFMCTNLEFVDVCFEPKLLVYANNFVFVECIRLCLYFGCFILVENHMYLGSASAVHTMYGILHVYISKTASINRYNKIINVKH